MSVPGGPQKAERSLFPVAVAAVVLVLLAIGAVLGIALGGGGGSGDVAETPTVIDASEFTVRISDFKFAPSNVSVPLGATVTWENDDSAPHDATDDDGEWKSERLNEGDSDSVTFDTAGTYTYHCSIHPYMKGALTVRSD